MEELYIEKSNALIAEFMGYKYISPEESLDAWGWYLGGDNKHVSNYLGCKPHYHEDWSMLMRVVEKIEATNLSKFHYEWDGHDGRENNFFNISVEIDRNQCWIGEELQLDPFNTINKITYKKTYNNKLQATFEAVVECIEYINSLEINIEENG